MKVLITGADGFVGTALTDSFRGVGVETVATARRDKPGYVGVGDLSGSTDWAAALTGCDVVVHLAARVHQMRDGAEDPLADSRRVNTEATVALARAAQKAGVKRFVFVSTVKVNGEESARPYQETDMPAPSDAYGISKWEAEQALMAMMQDGVMEVTIIRPPLVYGPGVKGNFASLVRVIGKGLPLPMGAIDNRRSLVALDNLVDFIALCADRTRSPRAANQCFLVSDDEDLSTSALLRKVAGAYKKPSRLIPVPASWLAGLARVAGKGEQAERLLGSLSVDITKAKTLLGWTPPVSVDQQLEKMARHAAHS